MSTNPTTTELTRQARTAGYSVVRIEQLRTNRWLLALTDAQGAPLLVLAQQRSLITAADVQDLAETLSLQRCPTGLLLAIGGTFSPEAWRTASELRRQHIQLCTSIPPTGEAPLPKAHSATLETV